MAMQNNMGMFWIIMLVGLVIITLFMTAYWFTTPLVALSDRKALVSYTLSFKSCLKNWSAFLVYGLLFLVIGVLVMIGFSVIGGLVSGFLTNGNTMLLAVTVLIMALVGLPLTIIGALSIYTSFRDIFYRSRMTPGLNF